MSSAKTERLLNLVICLLSTRRPLSKAQIRAAVPQYGESTSMEAFERMFERDKDELRDLGVPLATTHADPLFDDEVGYRIDRDAYALPEVSFEPDEMTVLGLASRVWQQASLAGPAARALTKLKAAGVEPDETSLIGLEPRVRTSEPSFEPLWAAVRDRVPVRFPYRRSGSAESTERRVEPWAVASWHGRWYLTGHDRDRQAGRVFRLSRITGEVRTDGKPGAYDVPPGHDAREMLRSLVPDRPQSKAVLRARAGSGQALRRRALEQSDLPGTGVEWTRLVVPYYDVEVLAEELTSYGPAVRAEEPEELRAAIVRRLTAVVTGAAS
ncbi:MAG: helix-turn-helix transcriptional regulator [Actinomycetales bacterium]